MSRIDFSRGRRGQADRLNWPKTPQRIAESELKRDPVAENEEEANSIRSDISAFTQFIPTPVFVFRRLMSA